MTKLSGPAGIPHSAFYEIAQDIRVRAGSFIAVFICIQQLTALPWWMEWVIALPLIGLLGISHGAIDHLISRELSDRKRSLSRILLQYTGTMAIYGAVWLFSPMAGLALFLLMSAYHFGEAELHDVPDTVFRPFLPVLYLCWGALILSAIFFLHQDIVFSILTGILPGLNPNLLLSVLSWIIPVTYTGFLLFLSIVLIRNWEANWSWVVIRLLGLHLLIALFASCSLLLSFAIFFGLWHALPVLTEEYAFLESCSSSWSHAKFVKQLTPFTLISLFGIGLFTAIVHWMDTDLTILFPVIAGIALLTLPHALVMRSMYRKDGLSQ